MKKTISIGSDHAGFELKEKIKDHLTKNGYWVYDKGCNSKDSCDYADFAHKVCQNLEKKRINYWNINLWFWKWNKHGG